MKSILSLQIVWGCSEIGLDPFMEFRSLVCLLIEGRCNGFAAAHVAKLMQCRALPSEVATCNAN